MFGTKRSGGSNGLVQAIHRSMAVVEFDLDGTVLTANDNFLEALGYRLDEIQGKHHRMFVEREHASRPEYRAFWQRLNDGELDAGEYLRIGNGGREVWIQASYNPILDARGKPVRVVKFATVITETKLRNADHEGQLAAIAKSQGVISFGLDGTILDANDNFLSLTGYRLDEIQGKHHRLFVDPAHASSAAYRSFWQRLADGQFDAGEYLRFGKGGKEIWIQATYNPILDARGRPVKVVKYASDISAQKALEANLQRVLRKVDESAMALGASSEELSAINEQLRANAHATSDQSSSVSSAADQVSGNVQAVAAGTEQMSASIQEIARSATEAAHVADRAVTVAEATNRTVGKLGESSIEIGKVVEVITSIAEKTDLLALNATIEAARAGEAGKGFAVVASEVKALARNTAKATAEIGDRVQAIQTDSQGAVAAIQEITDIIHQISAISGTIATAVEEQTATANEMSRSVSEAALGSSEIASSISGVAEAARSTTEGLAGARQAATDLARMAAELQRIVSETTGSGHAPAPPDRSGVHELRSVGTSPRARSA